jgi:hypothetical protein
MNTTVSDPFLFLAVQYRFFFVGEVFNALRDLGRMQGTLSI